MARVIVIGGANVDIKGRAAERMVAGTSNPGEVMISVGGVARNIAENLARLGVETSLVTVLGDDPNGRMILDACASANVDLTHALVGPSATGTYLAILDSNGELVSAVSDMRNIEWLPVGHLELLTKPLLDADFVVADCNIAAACLSWLCAFAARHAKRLLIEPVSVPKVRKLLDFKRDVAIFAITPNRQQLEALTGEPDETAAIARLHALGFSNVILHCGRDGAVASTGMEAARLPAFATDQIADVTGAGDAAVAGLICGLLAGHSLAEAARLGQAAASVKVMSRQSAATELDRNTVFRLAGFQEDLH